MILLMVVMILSLLATLWVIPRLMRGLKEHNMVVKDYYKRKETMIPSKGGMALLFVCSFAITVIPVLIYFSRQIYHWTDFDLLATPYLVYMNYFIMLPLLAYGTFGMFDDYLDIGRWIKVALPIIFAAPLVLMIDPLYLDIPFYGSMALKTTIIGVVSYRAIYRFIMIPLYIMVASNLVNMHSGFNGMATGTSLIILLTLIGKAFVEGYSGDIVSIGAFTGGLIALWIYNRYPSKIFEGNTGSLMIGAAIGITICVKGYLLSGFICLLPHTINFILWIYWKVRQMMDPKNPRYATVKWGKTMKDGTLKVPNYLTLKWVLPYFFKMNEKQVVYAMYGLTGLCCLIAFFIPY